MRAGLSVNRRTFYRSITQSAPDRRFLRPTSLEAEEQTGGSSKMLRMIMFGKPGAGKGTLSARLCKQFPVVSLSTGDLLRQHIAEKTPIGLQAESIVADGGFLPDELMLQVVTSKLKALEHKHWILDGFPRTLGQAKQLDNHLHKQGTPLSLVVNLDVPDDVILSRIADRYVHMNSGRVYNLSFNPPKNHGHDDITGEPLSKRPDDNPATFSKRLEKFYESTSPLISYYSKVASEVIPDVHAARVREHQHPHQLVLPKNPPGHQLTLRTLQGSTSDQIWPHLQTLVKTSFPALKEQQEYRATLRNAQHSLSETLERVQGSLASLRTPQLLAYK